MRCFFGVILMSASFVIGDSSTWKHEAVNGNWNDNQNWTQGVPKSSTTANFLFSAPRGLTVSFENYTPQAKEIFFGRASNKIIQGGDTYVTFSGVNNTMQFSNLRFDPLLYQLYSRNSLRVTFNSHVLSPSDFTLGGTTHFPYYKHINMNENFTALKNCTIQGVGKDAITYFVTQGLCTVYKDLHITDNTQFTAYKGLTVGNIEIEGGGNLSVSKLSLCDVTGTCTINGSVSIDDRSTFTTHNHTTIKRDLTINGNSATFYSKTTVEGDVNINGNGSLMIVRQGQLTNAKITIAKEGNESGILKVYGYLSLRADMVNNGYLIGPESELGFQGEIDKQGHKIIGTSGSHFTGNLKVEEGDVIFEPGSSLDIISNGSLISDMSIDVVRFEEGAHLNLLMEPPSSPEEWLHFLEHGDSGTFLQVNSIHGNLPAPTVNYPGFAATMTRSGNNFSLDIEPLPLASLVSNHNQQKVAEVFDEDHENESMDFIYANSELYFLQLPELQAALDTLHPALFNNIALAQEETTSYITKVLSQRLEEITWSSPDKKDRSWEIWGQGLRDYARQKGKHTLAGYTATTPGVIAGADVKIDNQFALGFHGAYTNSHINWERKQGHGHTTTGYGGLYGSWYTKNFLLGLSLLGGWNSSKASRSMHFGEIDRNAHHRVHGWEIAPQLELGGLWELDYISFEPFLKENYVYLHQNHYRESGAESLDLSVHSKNSDLLRSELGLGLFHCFQGKQLQFTPELKLSYIYESRFQGKNTTAYFLNNTVHPFTVKGLSPSRSLGHIGAFLKGSSYNGFDLTLDYNFLFGKEYRDHKMAVRLDYAF